MDIFKLGDKILDLLNVIFAFWNNQVSLVFALLGQSPTAFKDGKPWEVIEGLEPVFVAVGSSLVVLFFVIGFCSESIDIREEMRFEVILRILIRLGLAEYLVANNVTIMKAFFQSVGALVGLIAEGDRIELNKNSKGGCADGCADDYDGISSGFIRTVCGGWDYRRDRGCGDRSNL